jgi:hypothetical protein
MSDTVAATKLFHCFLHKSESGFVFVGSTATEVPKVCTKKDIGLSVFGRPTQIVNEIFGAVMECAMAPSKTTLMPPVYAVTAVRESFFSIVVTVADFPPDPAVAVHVSLYQRRLSARDHRSFMLLRTFMCFVSLRDDARGRPCANLSE